MAHFTGADLYITFGGIALHADYRTLSVDESTGTADTTAGTDEYQSHVITTKSVEMSLTLLYDNATAGTAAATALANGKQGTLEWGPEGTATGKPKYTIPATVTSFSKSIEYEAEVTYDVTLTGNGAFTNHFELSGSTW